MDRMLYVAMSGAKETMIAQASNSNNLANANAPGFLADLQQFRSMPVFGDGFPTRAYGLSESPGTDFTPGEQVLTGRDLDVAIAGEGWFAVQARDGSEAYSRRGDFNLDVNGLLTTGNGLPVLGNNGPIAIPPAEKLDIAPDGTISIVPLGQDAVEIAVVDRIKMVNPANDQLVKGKDGLVRLKSGQPAVADGAILLNSGAVAGSNVNIVNAMVDMIELSRRYEMQVKMMQAASKMEESSTRIMRMD